MAAISYNDAGTWRTPTTIAYNDAGTWRTLSAVHYNDAGTWRQVYSGTSVALTDHTVTGTGTASVDIASATFRLKLDGTAEMVETDGLGGSTTTPISGEWLLSGSASDYQARMTTVSGTLSSGTAGSWLALSSTRDWVKSRLNPAGSVSYVGTLEISLIADSIPIVSATITLTANVNP